MSLQSSAPRGYLKEYRAELNEDDMDVLSVLNDLISDTTEAMVHKLQTQQYKAVLVACVQMEKVDATGRSTVTSPFFRSKAQTVLQALEVEDVLKSSIDHIIQKLEAWIREGSGWVVIQVKSVHLDIARYRPMRISSYLPLPKSIAASRSFVNMRNRDDQCLK